MNTTAPTSPTPLLSVAGFRKFTHEQYHKLGNLGILIEGEPIELLEGYLVEKAVRNPPHETSLRRAQTRLPRFLPNGWTPQSQAAVILDDSEPEPDIAILRGLDSDYDGRIPVAADIGAVLEISDTSLLFDRRDKGRIYARNRIPVYWIVNVEDRQIEVYTNPQPAATPPEYATRTDYPHGTSVPVVLDGVTVATLVVADLIP